MSNSTSTIQGCFPLNTFHTLRHLWPQMAAVIGVDARSITDLDLDPGHERDLGNILTNLPQFSLLQSSKFQALLTGRVVDVANLPQIHLEIIFAPQEIDRFV